MDEEVNQQRLLEDLVQQVKQLSKSLKVMVEVHQGYKI